MKVERECDTEVEQETRNGKSEKIMRKLKMRSGKK